MDRVAFNAMVAQYATPEVSGDGRVSWDGGVRCVMPEVKLYGKCEQDGTPTPDAPVEIRCNNGVFAARGSNLFNIVGRGRGDLVSGSHNRQFSGDKYYYRISSNNYYKNEDFSVGDVQIDPENNSVSLQTKYSGYGLGFDFKTLPNKTYRLMAEVTGVCLIGVSFYTPGGTHISWVNITSLPSTFTTPDGTGWMVIIFRPYLDRGTYYNIRLTCGEEAAYTPYYDGGQATAPKLWTIPGTEYRDEWDAQTGQGVRRCTIIESYAGEAITTPYISSTGELSDGATVVYGIQDTPFYAAPARLTMPPGAGQIIQVGGDVADCPISAKFLTHS